MNILKNNFIDFLYLLKNKLILPIITLSQSNINLINSGYIINFVNNNIRYILYLYNKPETIIYEENVKKILY